MLSSGKLNRIGHLGRSLSANRFGSLRAFCSSENKNEELLKVPLSQKVAKSAYTTDDEEPQPITYTTSKAFSYKASETFRTNNPGPSSQYYIVTFSTAFFLIYFAFLREENDLDEQLYTPWAGNESILKTILQVHLKKTTDPEQIKQLSEKIAELDKTIGKKGKDA